MEDIKNKKINGKVLYFLIYSIFFAFLFAICFGIYFFKYKMSFFRVSDGLDQHYLAFTYIGEWIRDCFKGIFIDHTGIQLWNHGIGYGADILTSNGAYLPDFFNWISVFFPGTYSEIGFNIMIILKLYVTGLAFSYFGFYKKQPWWAVLIGSIVYTFSGTAYIVFSESFFINPMYIFPFIMVGVDKLLKENKPVLYAISLAYMFINYFYFAYMTCIAIFVYCLFSFIFDKDISRDFKTFFVIVKKFLLYSILAVGISAIVLLPILLLMSNMSRLDLNYYLPKLYNLDWYSGFVKGLTSYYSMSGRDAIIGYGVISIPCIALLFSQSKKNTKLKIIYLMATIGLCIPFIGKVFNGFSYYANRWVWIYALIVSTVVMYMITEFKNATNKQKYLIGFISILYLLLSQKIFDNVSRESNVISFFLILCVGILIFSSEIKEKYYKHCCILIAAISVIIPAYYYFMPKYGGAITDKVSYGTAYDKIYSKSAVSILNEIPINDGSRYDTYNTGRVGNTSWLYGISGMELYISLYNNDINKFIGDIGILSGSSAQEYHGLDRRAELEALFGVNHYIIRKDSKKDLPYGFTELESTKKINNDEFELYKSEENRSIVYGFKKAIGNSDFMNLSMDEKNQVIMKSIVIDDEAANSNSSEIGIENDNVDYQVSEINGKVERKNNSLRINNNLQEPAEFDLKLESSVNNSELMICIDKLEYDSLLNGTCGINVTCYNNEELIKDYGANVIRSNNKTHMYGGKDSFIINLGNITKEINTIRIKLINSGIFNIKDFRIVERKKESVEKNISELNKVANDITIEKNKISFNANLDEEQYVFISIPYSSGWKAKVNGKNTEILKADDAFMAIKLDKGNYNIELNYVTPGLLPGIAISIISVILLIIFKKKKIAITE